VPPDRYRTAAAQLMRSWKHHRPDAATRHDAQLGDLFPEANSTEILYALW